MRISFSGLRNALPFSGTIRNWHGELLPSRLQNRFMTSHKRVQDRSSSKRVHDLEVVTEKWKILSKVLAVVELLKPEQEMIIPVRNLERYRSNINLPKPHRISDFLRKSPKVFELYKDQKGVLWCGMTKAAEDLVEEYDRLIEENSDKAAEHVTRCLMMSVDKRILVDKIGAFRRDFGLPLDFRKNWVHRYPDLFRLVKIGDEREYLELVNWKPAWAITELEKKVLGLSETSSHDPGLLTLSFPMKFPPRFKKVYRYAGKIEHFQKRSYLSPYADGRGLTAGSLEFDKRAVAIMHELLSFTIEKRLVTDHLTYFRREFVMPQKLMRLMLKHFGIFYVSERGKRFSVFLTEAYEGRELIDKGPLVAWKEKFLSTVGYRGKKNRIESFEDYLSDSEYVKLAESESENESLRSQFEDEETMEGLEDALHVKSQDMEIEELGHAYKDIDSS